ncbi:hypothetical protein [Bacteroides cellulosilyticus]|uniref:hypothetical protein n=1 Tax=Bacteroides cellulosilyticus TaxID=246787 RepID=UPI0032EED807
MLKVKDDDVSNRHYNVNLAGTIMHIPERIYMSDLKPHRDMTNVYSIIIDCIFTRHYDGFIIFSYLEMAYKKRLNHIERFG